jgi:peptidoglycan/xylan/chitin deacetylase (PgdA/CDA1 family)
MARRSFNLTFHGVGDHERALYPGEDDVWVRADQFVSVLDWAADRDDVHVTFDDGNASDVRYALPALTARGMTATFFVVAARIGEPEFLDAADIVALRDAGMTIGCHGMCHRRWRHLDADSVHEETVAARRILEDIVEGPVMTASCPFGTYDRRVLETLRRSGYRRVFTSDGGPARPEAWLQARTTIGADHRGEHLDRLVGGDPTRLRTARRNLRKAAKRWR